MTIDEWWREERRRKFDPDPGYPAYAHDALENDSPCPWAFAPAALERHTDFNWPRLLESVKAALRRKR